MKQNEVVTITTRVDKKTYDAVIGATERTGLSISDILRLLIKWFLSSLVGKLQGEKP